MKMRHLMFIVIAALAIQACEDQVDVQLEDAPEALVVDAWINNKDEVQVIKLTKTQPYFDSTEPSGVSGANVMITDENGFNYSFLETESGVYEWDPAGSPLPTDPLTYTLSINAEGQNYLATSTMNRVPALDSLVFTFKEERNPFQPEGYYGEFVSKDPVGAGDSYWIKSYKNGQFLNRPFELNIAYDAGFNAGGNIDGVVFIQPIQDAVNPLNDELDAVVPYEPGDSLYVEIHSISNEAFFFLQEVQIQTQRDGGFDEIFAEPLENVATNIVNVSDNPSSEVVGFFTVSAVSSAGKRLEE